MSTTEHDLIEAIDAIDPALCSYEEWVQVGMALKDAGRSAGDWEAWSRRDAARYHAGECEKKWTSFRGSATPVTGGTIVAIARAHGWRPPLDEGHELSWDDIIGPRDEGVIIRDAAWVEAVDVPEPEDWDPAREIITYLSTLFGTEENVGYVTKAWERDGRFLPQKGNWDRAAGDLIDELSRCGGDIGRVLGDYRPEVGAWIRFNPLDGRGCKNDNVTEFRYALVESDTMAIDKQNAIIRKLELPVACLVHSGGKSLHAIVRVDAPTYDEYRKRVDYLYDVCRKNGLAIDVQNKNPSRLSRMPGIMRDGRKQFLVATNIGKESWAEWQGWVEASTDELPEPENLADVWDNMPALSPPLIDGILRQGHKLL
ncbi:MAG: PriCT-2 domain-containing protein, partial [Coriobacteriia bacterium]